MTNSPVSEGECDHGNIVNAAVAEIESNDTDGKILFIHETIARLQSKLISTRSISNFSLYQQYRTHSLARTYLL